MAPEKTGAGAAGAPASTASPAQGETTILVTGCSAGGIGYALVSELASRPGIFVIATARNVDAMSGLEQQEPEPSSSAAAAAAASSATPRGAPPPTRGRVALLPLDVTNALSVAACRAAVDALTRNRGVDILVNNAGATVQGALLDVPVDAARRVFAVNVLGGLAATQAFAPAMVARGEGGLVVNMGSAAGYASLPLKAVYSATKHAVRVLSDALRVELAPFAVRVLLVAPGYVRTAIDSRSREQGGWFGPAYGLSPYALYSKAAGIVGSSIFDEGGIGGGKSLRVEVFARRLADAMVGELEGARRCARAGTTTAGSSKAASLSSVVRVGKAARAWASALVPFGGRRRRDGGKGDGDDDDEEQRAPLVLAGCPTTASARARLASPPAGLDLLLEPRAWLPAALGGPTRHLRLGPCSTSAWLSGSLLPLWASDLIFGRKMGLWGAGAGGAGAGAGGGGGGGGAAAAAACGAPASAAAQVTVSASAAAAAASPGKKGLGKKQQ